MDALRATLSPRYMLEAEVGRGGMAVVFRARDQRHDRHVAIKVLLPEHAEGLAPERFHREIQTTAQLQHPHILPLHDSGEAGGILYFITPYVEGESLAQRQRAGGPLPVGECLRIAAEVADALAYAHARGVIHRDIKPGNILLVGKTHACVADFGLARIFPAGGDTRITTTGVALGSPLYMSPEQIRGLGEVDGRSDVYSLGCTLFEAVTGNPPFSGTSVQAVLLKHMSETPPPLRAAGEGVSRELERLVFQMLQKDPQHRPSAAEVAARLQQIQQDEGHLHFAGAPPGKRPSAWRHVLAGSVRSSGPVLVVLLFLTLVAAGSSVMAWRSGRLSVADAESAGAEARPRSVASVAVLPFENASPDPDVAYFGEGVAASVADHLSRVGNLKVISSTAAGRYRHTTKDLREVARELRAHAVLAGRVRRERQRIWIDVRLVDAVSGQDLWKEEFDRPIDDVFALENEIAARTAAALRARVTPEERIQMARNATADLSAYDFFMKGRDYLHRFRDPATIRSAIALFDEALQRDPEFAAAAAGKGRALQMLYQYTASVGLDSAILYSQRAIELDPELSDGYTVLGRTYLSDGRPVAARVPLERALELNPNDVAAVSALRSVFVSLDDYREAMRLALLAVELAPTEAVYYGHVGFVYILLLDWDSAEEWLQAALRLEPDEPWANALLVYLHAAHGRYSEALPHLQVLLDAAPNGGWAYTQAAWFEMMRGEFEAAARSFERSDEASTSSDHLLLERAFVLRSLGRLSESESIFQRQESWLANRLEDGLNSQAYGQMARLHAARGDREQALAWLQSAYDRGYRDASAMLIDPLLNDLRDDSRFQRILAASRADVDEMREQVEAQASAGDLAIIPSQE